MAATIETLSDLVFLVAEQQKGRKDLVSWQDGRDRNFLSTADWVHRTHCIAAALEADGVGHGDRVAIFSENCPEWHNVEFACQLLGAISVPIYPTLPADQVAYILSDSGCDRIFYSDKAKAKVLESVRGLGSRPLNGIAFKSEAATPRDDSLGRLLERGAEIADSKSLDEFRSRPRASDVASLIYTSGTTGNPKGVILSHHNLISNVLACADLFPLSSKDLSLSFLPLSHVLQRTVDNLFFYKGVSIHYVSAIERVPRALTDIRPTVLASVPRLYERAYLRVKANADNATANQRRIFDWALDVGARYSEGRRAGRSMVQLAVQHRLANRLVHQKIKDRMGGRLRFAITGGAALPEVVSRFFAAIGLDLFEGYGLTETAPVLAICRPGIFRWGTVGTAVPGVELKIADDGEIMARTPGLMQGYWENHDATVEVIEPDGWFHTGDIGTLDTDGYLKITDRKKDLLVTSGGKNIAPQPIEQLLTSGGVIAQAVVLGDNYPYLTALLVPNLEDLPEELQGLSPEERAAHPRLLEPIEKTVGDVNRRLADHERIRRWKLLPQELTLEAGEITPTLKIKRRVVLERYSELVASMYLKSQRVDG
jgi:long-chain acyl-CoA synthetase